MDVQTPEDVVRQAAQKRANTAAALASIAFCTCHFLGPVAMYLGVRARRELTALGQPTGTAIVAIVISSFSTLITVFLLVGIPIFVLVVAFGDPHVRVANGSSSRRAITVDGTAMGGVRAGKVRHLVVPDGVHRICVQGTADAAPICSRKHLQSGERWLFNPGGESRFAALTVHYGFSPASTPGPTVRPVPRQEWYETREYDALFEDPPEELQIPAGRTSESRTALVWSLAKPVVVAIDNPGAASRSIRLDSEAISVDANHVVYRDLVEGEHTLDLGDGTPPRRLVLRDFGAYVVDLDATRAYRVCSQTGRSGASGARLEPAFLHDRSRDAALFGEPTPWYLGELGPATSWVDWGGGDCARPESIPAD